MKSFNELLKLPFLKELIALVETVVVRSFDIVLSCLKMTVLEIAFF